MLVRLLPDAVRLRSPEALIRQIEISESAGTEARRAKEALEVRVAERTAELEAANQKLREEIWQRQRAEETLRIFESNLKIFEEHPDLLRAHQDALLW